MYRLESSDELFDIGWEDYLRRGGVCAVEWSEKVADALAGAIRVDIRRGDGDTDRVITVSGDGRQGDGSSVLPGQQGPSSCLPPEEGTG